MSMGTHEPSHARTSAADRVRRAIESGGERVWTIRDFSSLPPPVVAQTLSRLTRSGAIQRVGKGLYYKPRRTAFGTSRPNPKLFRSLAGKGRAVFPAGLTAAHLLGFSTQVPAREELATTRGSLPRAVTGRTARVHTRRPEAWAKLTEREAALLDFIRRRAEASELSPEETVRKLLMHLAEGDTFGRLARVAAHEPPRVRAMLGALGDALGKDGATLARLKSSLNPLSTFDFGVLSVLQSARSWQAKTKGGG